MICRGCGWLITGDCCPECGYSPADSKPEPEKISSVPAVSVGVGEMGIPILRESRFSRLMPWVLGVFLPMALLFAALSVFFAQTAFLTPPGSEGKSSDRQQEVKIVGLWQNEAGNTVFIFHNNYTGAMEKSGVVQPFTYLVRGDKLCLYTGGQTVVYNFFLYRNRLTIFDNTHKLQLVRVEGGTTD